MKLRRRWQLALLALVVVLALICPAALFVASDSKPLAFDLHDGTRLEIVHVSVSTNHIAHFGSSWQKLAFKIAGPRLSPKWVGYQMVTPAQDQMNGNLGIFVRHRDLSGEDRSFEWLHNLKIRPTSVPREPHSMFLSSGHGEFGLWELNYWNENYSDFVIENSKGEIVGRFSITKGPRGSYAVKRGDHE
jgi:hypothetical protein